MSKHGENIRKRKDGRWEVAILRDESLIGPQSGGTFTDIPTPRLRKDSLLKNGGATI